MKIKSLQYKRYSRRFRTPLITSHGPISERTGWLIRLEDEGGLAGFGEAADSLPGFGPPGSGVESDRTAFLHLEDSLQDSEFEPLRVAVVNFISFCPASISSLIRFGFETAVCDLAARVSRMPLSDWIKPDAASAVPVNYLVSSPVNNWDRIKADIADSHYPAIKVKIGAGSISDDITTVKQLRTILDRKVTIRLDANQAWDYNTALAILDVMAEYGIDYVEEPLKNFEPDLLIRLKEETGIKIALDESLSGINDLGKVLSMKACDVLIIKPAVRGGIIASMGNSFLASSHGCRAVLTSNLETEIGIAAQLHLAAALPGELHPCGLDTLRLFEQGEASLMRVADGCIKVPPGNGIGDGIGERAWNSL